MNSSILYAVFLAIVAVESGGNDSAYNEREGAAGCAQIREICLRDVNSWGYNYTLADRFDRQKSFEIFCIYTKHYGAKTMEDAILLWNAGPTGWKKGRGKEYLKKVQIALAKLKK